MNSYGIVPDAEAHAHHICALAKARQPERAMAAYEAARAAGIVPDQGTYAALLCVVDRYGAAPAPGSALADTRRLWADMRAAGLRPSTFTHRALVASFCRAGEVAEARDAALEIGASSSGGRVPPIVALQLAHGATVCADFGVAREAVDMVAAAGPGADPSSATRLVLNAIRAGEAVPEATRLALHAYAVLRPLYWAGAGGSTDKELVALRSPLRAVASASPPEFTLPATQAPTLARMMTCASQVKVGKKGPVGGARKKRVGRGSGGWGAGQEGGAPARGPRPPIAVAPWFPRSSGPRCKRARG